MPKYTVMGNTQVTVSITVNAKNPEEAMKKAKKKFAGIHSYLGNGGDDKIIGVENKNETIAADEPVIWDDCMPA